MDSRSSFSSGRSSPPTLINNGTGINAHTHHPRGPPSGSFKNEKFGGGYAPVMGRPSHDPRTYLVRQIHHRVLRCGVLAEVMLIVYTVWAFGSNETFKAAVFHEITWVNHANDDSPDVICLCMGYNYHSYQPIWIPSLDGFGTTDSLGFCRWFVAVFPVIDGV